MSRRRRLASVCALIVSAFFPSGLEGQCEVISGTPVPALATRDRFCFVLAFVQSLGQAHMGVVPFDSTKGVTNPIAGFAEMLYGIETRRRGLFSASLVILPSLTSRDSVVRSNALLTLQMYAALMRSDSVLAAMITDAASGRPPAPGDWAVTGAKIRSDNRAVLFGLIAIFGKVSAELVVSDPKTGRSVGLDISSKDRDEILAALRVNFGSALKNNAPDATDYSRVALGVLEFFQDSWKLRRSP